METKKEAIRYLEKGFSVIPLRKKSKLPPPHFSWTEFQKRQPSLDEINKWFDNI